MKAISADLTRQKDRLERFLRTGRAWDHAVWRSACADHRTTGALARRLVWRAETAGGAHLVLPTAAGAEDVAGNPVGLSDAHIRLWHPLDEPEDMRALWRAQLATLGIVQPVRQAWRETYAVTPAERERATYSNRFAGHGRGARPRLFGSDARRRSLHLGRLHRP